MANQLVPVLLTLLLSANPTSAESGSTEAAPSPSPSPAWEVPFGCGYAFPVSQTHNTGSHLQNDSWAWDFRMPEGTPVAAARGGVVRMARGDSTEGGCDPKFAAFANYVVVNHGDGLETQYLHFSQVVVKAGQRVKAGDLLGFSGKTGWACGAHLHFKVARYVGEGWNNPSVPAKFAAFGDPALESMVAAPVCSAGRTFVASRPPAVTSEAAVKAALASARSTAGSVLPAVAHTGGAAASPSGPVKSGPAGVGGR